jgi:hypothetical protein
MTLQNLQRYFIVVHVDGGYLVDTCAGGTWRARVDDAVEFATPLDAYRALVGAEINEPARLIAQYRIAKGGRRGSSTSA